MLAAGIVQDTFAGKAGEGERGRRSGDDWRLLLPPGPEILPVSQQLNLYRKSHARARIRNLRTYVRMYPFHKNEVLVVIGKGSGIMSLPGDARANLTVSPQSCTI